jgi:DNA repair protein RadA/Sms
LKEAAKLGFAQAALPKRVAGGAAKLAVPASLRLVEIGHLTDLVAVATRGVKPSP